MYTKSKLLKFILKGLFIMTAFSLYSLGFSIFYYFAFNNKRPFTEYLTQYFEFFLSFITILSVGSVFAYLFFFVVDRAYNKFFN